MKYDDPRLYEGADSMMRRYGTERALEMCEEGEVSALKDGDVIKAGGWRGLHSAIRELDGKLFTPHN